ncbi:MAG: ATP phosphoribosyltransferase regulatory subunit [Lachnospiraceae bacterium]|nr:ATP phosphoribosyltransferase regulatory subunit [Lachnospiraceae bacterium]
MSRDRLQINKNFKEDLMTMYNAYGFKNFKVNRFEEYDVYVENKDFFADKGVITFMDTDGKLLALKPDVTLSILKNVKDNSGEIEKYCYCESVFRVSARSRRFEEMTQIGVESIGPLFDYHIAEVLLQAVNTLRNISKESELAVSNLEVIALAFQVAGIPREIQPRITALMGAKNLHELQSLCEKEGVSEEGMVLLKELMLLSGSIRQVCKRLQMLLGSFDENGCIETMENILKPLENENIRLDFTVVSNMKYYNGFVFLGYIKGIPDAVLFGGQYDRLLQQMKKGCKGMGFALDVELLLAYLEEDTKEDMDVVLLYEDGVSIARLMETAKEIVKEGRSVLVEKELRPSLCYNEVIKLEAENGRDD